MRLLLFAGFCTAASVLACAPAPAAPEGPKLAFPLACQIGADCEVQHYVDRDPGPGVLDYHCGRRTYDGHNGVDIRLLDMAQERNGVAVLAAAPGKVARLRDGVQDISVRDPAAPSSKGQECGNGVVIDHGDGWETQYCHLARGSVRVKAGDQVKAGDPIAKVGLSGNTEFPHLHLTVRHDGKIVDPFAPAVATGQCATGGAAAASMWTPQAQRVLAYKAGAILNVGFAGGPVTMADVEGGAIARPNADSPLLVAYMRGIELETGDVLDLSLTAPDGAVIAGQKLAPLDHDKAQHVAYVGRKRPAVGWPKGRYVAQFRVIRAGKLVAERQATFTLA
jgi:hypothetical protein